MTGIRLAMEESLILGAHSLSSFMSLECKFQGLALIQQKPMENSAYTNCVGREKNCYMVFSSNSSEDCYYGSWVNSCKDCVDSLSVESCELCYECNGCRNCYKLLFSRDCIDCSDSYFLRDCTSCKNCLGCNSLVGKEYCLFNKEVGKEKYLEFLNSIDFGSYEQVEKLKTQIESALGVVTVKELHGAQNENSSGDYLRNCRDTYYSFEVNNAEELRYCVCLQDARTSMDHSYWGKNSELIYECQACGFDVYHLRFCNLCWSGCSNLTYCEHCFSSQDCLGSIGLKKQKYCIFNKKYSKKEYLELSQEIIAHMKKTGEWGEYFPVEHSTYSYNESLAHEQFPMSKSEVLKKGWNWLSSEDDKELKYIGGDTELPDNIKDAGKDVVGKIFKCLDSGKLYKITLPEFEFYQRMNIPLPRLSADARHLKRLTARNPRMLWDRQCASCDKGIKTSYAPARPERVFL